MNEKSTINQLSNYFNRTQTPVSFHEVDINIFEVFLMEEDYQTVRMDLEWEFPAGVQIRYKLLKSKSEMRRMKTMFLPSMKRVRLPSD